MQQRGCSGEPCGIQLCNDSDQRQTSGGLRFKKVLNQLLLCCLSLKDWKAGRSLFAKVQPKYNPTPEETVGTAKIPTLKICNMVNGHLSIPQEMRQKWLNDPIRSFSFDPYAVFCVCCFLGSN